MLIANVVLVRGVHEVDVVKVRRALGEESTLLKHGEVLVAESRSAHARLSDAAPTEPTNLCEILGIGKRLNVAEQLLARNPAQGVGKSCRGELAVLDMFVCLLQGRDRHGCWRCK